MSSTGLIKNTLTHTKCLMTGDKQNTNVNISKRKTDEEVRFLH
jgi:hypothetical protein